MRIYIKAISTLALLTIVFLHINAQPKDSIAIATLAKKDAKNFKMDSTNYKKFKNDRNAFTRQYKTDGMRPAGLNQPFRNPIADLKHNREIKENLNKIDYYSGFFNPNLSTTSDTALLKDSLYVRVFRDAAYKRTVNNKTITTVVFSVAGGILLIIGLIAFYRANLY